MTRVLGSLALSVTMLLGLLALGLAPADADSRRAADPRGDAARGIDITGWRVNYGERNIVAVARVRGLEPREYRRFALVLPSMSGPEGSIEHVVLSIGRDLRRSVHHWYERETTERRTCDGLRASISYRKDRIKIVAPRRCLGFEGSGDSWDRRDFRITANKYSRASYKDGYFAQPEARDFTRKLRLSAG